MGKRADNKTGLQIYVDKDFKATFKKIAEKNKTCMSDVILQAIQNYVKEHEDTLQAK